MMLVVLEKNAEELRESIKHGEDMTKRLEEDIKIHHRQFTKNRDNNERYCSQQYCNKIVT